MEAGFFFTFNHRLAIMHRMEEEIDAVADIAVEAIPAPFGIFAKLFLKAARQIREIEKRRATKSRKLNQAAGRAAAEAGRIASRKGGK